MPTMKAAKCPSDELSLTNRAIVSYQDFPEDTKHVQINTGVQTFVFTITRDKNVQRNTVGFSLPQRKWAILSINQDIVVTPYKFDQKTQVISCIVLETDFLQKKNSSLEPYNTDSMALKFIEQFPNQAFSKDQQLVFSFEDKKLLALIVKEIEVSEFDVQTASSKSKRAQLGVSNSNMVVVFEKAEGSSLNLVGKAKGKTAHQSIINPDWDFAKMGIGGLDNEFSAIFRRAFASRVFPPEIVEQLGGKHVKGIILYGPPGTGKTLMARQIGKMLNAREPKIVNGPQILDKYVGESEANVRRLFAEAEEEEKRMGPNSGLHIIIFDEIDAICKARGSVAGNTGVHDTVVNQLLAKIDGVEQLNNILVIGMTNRKDMIDEALLRPGRLEVQMEIGLPDEAGRIQILNIHTARMRENKKLSTDVDLKDLGFRTKNFSGAEIEGLVRAAQSTAMNRLIKAASKVEIDPEASEKLLVTREDFRNALENDIKPAFGTSLEKLDHFLSRGIINWGDPITRVLHDGALLIEQARSADSSGLVTILLEGLPNAGKTALASEMAKRSDFPFLKVCSPEDMVGFTETAKCMMIRKVFDDAYKSHLSCILVDEIERLLDYGPIGPRYSNLVLQALLVLLKMQPPKGRKLLIICTTSYKNVLEEMGMLTLFTAILPVCNLSRGEHMLSVFEASESFSPDELNKLKEQVEFQTFDVGIKKLLAFIDMARQMEGNDRVSKFLDKLTEEGLMQ